MLGSALTHTHNKQTYSNNDRFAFRGQVSEQEGSGAGGTEKLALLGWAPLHASWHCQLTALTFSLHWDILYILSLSGGKRAGGTGGNLSNMTGCLGGLHYCGMVRRGEEGEI